MRTGMTAVLAIALALAAAGCGRGPQKSVEELAGRFFGLLAENQTAEAYAMLAEESRNEGSLEQFQAAAEILGLAGNQGVAWDKPYIDDDYGTIEGVVTTRNGSRLSQEVVCFRKGRTWQIHIVREPLDTTAMDLIAEARLQQPDPDGMGQLAMGTIRLLADALSSGQFETFHRETAPLLREQTTPEVFRESFEWLASPEVGFDWAAVRAATPVFDAPPVVDADGLLRMAGHVPAGEKRLKFKLEYVYEPPMWMPTSIDVSAPL